MCIKYTLSYYTSAVIKNAGLSNPHFLYVYETNISVPVISQMTALLMFFR